MLIPGVLLLCLTAAQTQTVIHTQTLSMPLAERWREAMTKGENTGGKFFVGYSIGRLMNEDTYFSCGTTFRGNVRTHTTLYELIEGKPRPSQSVKAAARSALARARGIEGFTVMKDVAILAGYTPSRGLTDAAVVTMDLGYDFGGAQLYWLGAGTPEEHAGLVSSLFDKATTTDAKENVVAAAGMGNASDASFSFLSGVLTGTGHNDVREKAAFWIGEQADPRALQLLLQTATEDRSGDVREHAVFAISRIPTDNAVEALISLGRSARDRDVREKAVFWLGQTASAKAVAELDTIVHSNADSDIQRRAVWAIASMEDGGIDRLISIATTHRNPSVRKAAIMALGNSDDPRAFDTLVKIVRKR